MEVSYNLMSVWLRIFFTICDAKYAFQGRYVLKKLLIIISFFLFQKMYFYKSNDWMKINFLKLKLAWIIFQILCSILRYKKNRHTMQSAKLLRCWSTVKRTPLKLPRSTSIQQRRLVNLFKFHWLVHRACDKKCDI